jgi:hypothetical protein
MGAKMVLWWLCSLNCVSWQKIYKTNVKERLSFIGGLTPYCTQHPNPEEHGPYEFMEPWSINFT